MSENNLLPALFDNELTLAAHQASEILRTSKVPEDAIYTHPGKGGQQFEYIKHTWATRLIQNALDQRFSFDVLEAQVAPDGSAWARVRFVEHIPYRQPDGTVEWFENSITEIGAFEGNDKMSYANKLASATSRGLLRCLMRRYGLGLELYGDEDQVLTFEQAWSNLITTARNYVSKRGQKDHLEPVVETIKNALKAAGISKENMIDRFSEAYGITYTVLRVFYAGEDPDFTDESEDATVITKESAPSAVMTEPEKRGSPESAPEVEHWSQDIATVERLLEQVRPMGIGSEQVRQALGVPRVSGFRGTKEDAIRLIRQWIIEHKDELQKRQEQGPKFKVRVDSGEAVVSPLTEGQDEDWL